MTASLQFSDPALRRQWQEISREADPRLRLESQLQFALQLENIEHIAAAAEVYAQVAAQPDSDGSRRARERLELLEGKGGFGARWEFQARRFARQAADPRFFIPLLAGSLAFQLGRGLALGRLAGMEEAAWFNRGAAARGLAALAGFAAEVPAFTLLQRELAPSHESLAGDLRAAAFSLGALKLFAFGGSRALGPLDFALNRAAGAPGLAAAARATLPQLSALLGLLAVQRAEIGLGWRAPAEFGGLFADGMLLLGGLRIGEGLGRRVLGNGFAAFQHELELRAAGDAATGWRPPGAATPELTPAAAGGLAGEIPPRQDATFHAVSLMASGKDGDGAPPLIPGMRFERDYRGRYPFPSPEEAAKTAAVLRAGLMDRSWDPDERLKCLDSLASFAELFAAKPERKALTLDLRRLIRDPKVEWEHPVASPEQSVPFYSRDHLLRVRAAELHRSLLKKDPATSEEREAFLETLRAAILEPGIPTRLKAAGKHPDWGNYFTEAERHLRETLLFHYARSLRGLRTEAPEVMEGMRMLASPTLQQLARGSLPPNGAAQAPLEGGKVLELFPKSVGDIPPVKRDIALAYAGLLEAASMYQREISAPQRQILAKYVHWLEPLAAEGDEGALRALVEIAPHDDTARRSVSRFKFQGQDSLQEKIRRFETEAKRDREARTEFMRRKIEHQQDPRKNLLGWLMDLFSGRWWTP